MTNLLTGHEDYITSHTRKEIMLMPQILVTSIFVGYIEK